MDSKVIDTKEVSEKYTSANGNKKTRIHTIRAMNNNGSEFINYRCGRNSVNISRGMWSKLQEVKLDWENKPSDTNAKEEKLHQENVSLQKQINDLKKLIKGK